eukprot:scaffold125875_cov63-Phaeocystis_antarctica.AAC.3
MSVIRCTLAYKRDTPPVLTAHSCSSCSSADEREFSKAEKSPAPPAKEEKAIAPGTAAGAASSTGGAGRKVPGTLASSRAFVCSVAATACSKFLRATSARCSALCFSTSVAPRKMPV